MAFQQPKTDAEWEVINFRNSIDPKLGGLVKSAVNLAIAEKKTTKENISDWLDMLYDIVEEKKNLILNPPKEETKEKAENLWAKKKQELYNEDSQLGDINAELNEQKYD